MKYSVKRINCLINVFLLNCRVILIISKIFINKISEIWEQFPQAKNLVYGTAWDSRKKERIYICFSFKKQRHLILIRDLSSVLFTVEILSDCAVGVENASRFCNVHECQLNTNFFLCHGYTVLQIVCHKVKCQYPS